MYAQFSHPAFGDHDILNSEDIAAVIQERSGLQFAAFREVLLLARPYSSVLLYLRMDG
jgi:hypothetical protein